MSQLAAKRVLLIFLAVGSVALAPVGASEGTLAPVVAGESPEYAHIVALYPNPYEVNDGGEFVVLSIPRRGNWSVGDGESTVSLPANATGRIVVTREPIALPNGTQGRVVAAPSAFALANRAERIDVARNGTTVDSVAYENAPEGQYWRWNRTPRWRPLGFTPREVHASGATSAKTFVLPDAPGPPIWTLEEADRRILLAGYTFSSPRVARTLVAASNRGATVRVLVDDAPVGGISVREATVLDRLAANGVDVSVVGGERATYDYHHSKYAVVDDRSLVLTENWKPAGTGGRSSRGWGVRVDSSATTDELAEVFRADASGPGATPWSEFRRGRSFTITRPSNGSYPSRFAPEAVDVDRVRLVTAPGNAERAVGGVLDNATDRIAVVQPTVGSRHHPFLRATLRAAERGVEVRILLSGAWYVEEENRRFVGWLNDRAERRGLPLEARVAEPNGRFEKIHAKGVIVDDRVVLGSMNWNNNSVRENREVAIVLDGEEPANYYRRVFTVDWQAGGDGLPVGVVLAAVLAVLGGAGVAWRRIEFEEVDTE